MKKSYLCLEDLLLTKNKFMKKNLSLKLMLLWMASIMFALNLSAQTVNLSPEQCGHAIHYGEPIFCTANDSALEYEFKFFTSQDTTIITSQRNYIPVETYYNVLQTDLAYRTIVRCHFSENWGAYGDTCININIKNFAAGTYILEINGCYGNVYQTKIIKL